MTDAQTTVKDAIIYVPGLGQEVVDQRIDTIARRICGALESNTNPAKFKFRINKALDEQFGRVYESPVRTIEVETAENEQTQPLADLYMLDYRGTLTSRFKGRNPLSKVLVMLSVLLAVLPKSLFSLTKPSKSLKDKIQVMFICTLLAAIVAYIAIILSAGLYSASETPQITINSWQDLKAAVVSAIDQTTGNGQSKDENTTADKDAGSIQPPLGDPTQDTNTSTQIPTKDLDDNKTATQIGVTPAPAQDPPADISGRSDSADLSAKGESTQLKSIPSLFQAIIVIVTALGLFKKKSFKESASAIATEFVCAGNYLRLANQKQIILGQAEDLLEHLAEKDETYSKIHFVAFSFGTLIALDLLFPHARPGARLDTVKSLVTIGCPFDLVRTYWPNYFSNRHHQSGFSGKWINLYAPLDIFGSNFRNDDKAEKAEQGIAIQGDADRHIMPEHNICYKIGMQTDQLTLFDILAVKGAKNHTIYWTGNDASEKSCFDEVAHALYGTTPIPLVSDNLPEKEDHGKGPPDIEDDTD